MGYKTKKRFKKRVRRFLFRFPLLRRSRRRFNEPNRFDSKAASDTYQTTENNIFDDWNHWVATSETEQKEPRKFVQEIKNVVYQTDTATVIARADLLNQTTFLLRSPNGQYFAYYQDETDHKWSRVLPISVDQARGFYKKLEVKAMDLESAFPSETPRSE